MKFDGRHSILVAAVCAGLALNASAAAPKKKEKTIGDLSSRPVVVQPDQKVEASAARAMDNYRRFLELQKTDPQLRAEALRRLGDLNIDRKSRLNSSHVEISYAVFCLKKK